MKTRIRNRLGLVCAAALLAAMMCGRASATTYTWANTGSGSSGYWTNTAMWSPSSAYPVAGDTAYLTNTISSGAYAAIYDYAPGLGTLTALVVSNSAAGQAWLLVTNAPLDVTTFTLGSGGVLEIANGGSVTNKAAANVNWWFGANGTLYLDSGSTFVTPNAVTLGKAISNVNATVSTRSTSGSGIWNGNAQTFTIGSGAATGNVLRIDGNGVAGGAIGTNVNIVTVGSGTGANGNSLIITNGGRLFSGVGIHALGYSSGSNSIVVGGGATSVWNLGNQQITIGSGGGAGNLLRIDGSGVYGGAIVTNVNRLYVGSDWNPSRGGAGNSLIITNGGQLLLNAEAWIGSSTTNSTALVMGGGSGGATSLWSWVTGTKNLTIGATVGGIGGIGNVLQVDGNGVTGGAIVNNLSTLYVGSGAGSDRNSLIITNGGRVAGTPLAVTIGSSCRSNAVIVASGGSSGPASVLDLGTGVINVGSGGGNDNSLVITNGGQLFSGHGSAVGNSSSGNRVLLVGGGSGGTTSTWTMTGEFYVGPGSAAASNNVLTIDGNGVYGGAILSATKAWLPYYSASAGNGNSIIITNGGQLVTTGEADIGYSTTNNTMLVMGGGSGGATSLWNLNAQTLYVGRVGATGTVFRVDGNGVTGGAIVTNAGTMYVGSSANQNNLIITNGGQFRSKSTVTIGNTGSNNTALVVGGGGSATSRWDLAAQTLTIGSGAATGNVLTVSAGGVVTNISTLTVSANNTLSLGAGGQIYAGSMINAGTFAATLDAGATPAVGRLDVTGNLNLNNTRLDVSVSGTLSGVYVIASYGTLTGSFGATNGLPANCTLDMSNNKISIVGRGGGGTVFMIR